MASATATRFGLSRGLLGLQYDQINESESESESTKMTFMSSHTCLVALLTSANCSGFAPLLYGSTLLTVTDGVTVFAFCTRSSIFSLISLAGTFPITSRVPPTITIFVTSRLSSWRTSSIMSPMSSSVAPDFLRMAIVSIPTAETSRDKLFL